MNWSSAVRGIGEGTGFKLLCFNPVQLEGKLFHLRLSCFLFHAREVRVGTLLVRTPLAAQMCAGRKDLPLCDSTKCYQYVLNWPVIRNTGQLSLRVVWAFGGQLTCTDGCGHCATIQSGHAPSSRLRVLKLHGILAGHFGTDCSLSLDDNGMPQILQGTSYTTRAKRPWVYIYELPPVFNAW
eukprot:1161130-Pelagomonas_calceolata.AAC.6